MSVLLDTNIIVDLLNGHPQARDYLRSLPELQISSITVYEILGGCVDARSNQLDVAEILINSCTVLAVTETIAARAAQYQRKQKLKRKMADFLIEATAEEFGLELATRNPKDFRKAKIVVPYTL